MVEIGSDIGKAKNLLVQGELVAIPTETVYGLAANALDSTAVEAIFRVKQRPFFDPLIVHCTNLDQVSEYVVAIPPLAKELADAFWPGPMTLILEKKKIIPDIVTAGLPTVGLRCIDHPMTQELLAQLSFPLAAPSANPFGYVSPTLPQHVTAQLGSKIPYILDGGRCDIGIESTIIGFEKALATIYRSGGISYEDLVDRIGVMNVEAQGFPPSFMPGNLINHYTPKTKIVLGNIDNLLQNCTEKTIGILRFQHQATPNNPYEKVLSRSGNLAEAAYNLFFLLRQLDDMNLEIIFTETVPDVGIGKAINERLSKAATK